jgi:hypothetical protein
VVEAVFAIFAAGLIGAVSQRLRASQPVWETAAIVCLGLPALMMVAQLGVHRAAHTPHVGVGVFSWYAMRHGACSVAPIAHHSYTTFAVCRE